VSRRIPLVFAIVVALGSAIVLDRVVAEPSGDDADASGTGLPTGDELSVSWFCAEGTAAPDGRAGESILVGNVGAEEIEALITVMPGGDELPATSTIAVPAGTTSRVEVSEVLEAAEPGVVVETFGGPSVVEHELRTDDGLAVGPCARAPETRWLFAAGTTTRNSAQYLTLFNPFGEDAIVDVTYFTEDGPEVLEPVQGLVVPRRSRLTVPIHDQLRRENLVGIDVQARVGRLVAERSMVFAGTEEGLEGLTLSLGAAAPANEWWIPLGDADGGSDVRLVLANPGELPADVEVTALVQGENQVGEPQQVVVAPQSLAVVDLDQLGRSGARFALVARSSSEPVVAEMLVGWTGGEGGTATTLGSVAAAERWAFAAGRLPGDDGGIAVLNPGLDVTSVSLFALDAGAERVLEEVEIAPGERHVFDVRALDLPEDQPVAVVAATPVVAARVGFTRQGSTLSPGVPG
jgi:Family of unknown function (DUF5719)